MAAGGTWASSHSLENLPPIGQTQTDEAFRRRGAARALLDACAEECRRRGCHVLTLESGHHRAEAHRLYESYGFVHHARAYILTL